MELEFHAFLFLFCFVLFFYIFIFFIFIYIFFIFLSLIRHNSILNQMSFSLKLDIDIIEFQNRGTNLYSFKTRVYCQIFLKIGVKG